MADVRRHYPAPRPQRRTVTRLAAPRRYRALHLFCGSGGGALGFREAGFQLAGAIDIDPRCAIDFRALTAVRRIRPEPVRDLFEAPITWTPPQEFTNYLNERANASPPAQVPAPAPVLLPEVSIAPAAPGRDFAAEVERVQDGDLLVIRERGEHGHHTYRAFERGDAFFHHITIDELTWGRVDTRRLGHLDPYGAEVYQKSLEYSLEAQKVIRQICPETRRSVGDFGIYDGPGYVLLTVDPAPLYRAARALEVPT